MTTRLHGKPGQLQRGGRRKFSNIQVSRFSSIIKNKTHDRRNTQLINIHNSSNNYVIKATNKKTSE